MTLPRYATWGVWGEDDELGTLNLLTDERTLAAARLVARGAVFNLQLPLEEPAPGIVWRTRPRHEIVEVGRGARDDFVDGLWLQGSSQWDGLAHMRHAEHGNYNGIDDSEIHGGPGTRLGVDRWAARAVVGRGVLVDVHRHLASLGEALDVGSAFEISPGLLDATLAAEGVELVDGDIVLLHTGWLRHVLERPVEERGPLLDAASQQVPGLEVSERTLEWLWDHHVAAIAADNAGVEACSDGKRFELHGALLGLLGIPLGEYWWLHDLAEDCAGDGRYAFLLVSVPLNVRGGVGSPAQAVAIK